ncbi:MAG: sarcosine oxidase subunit alpha family protein [Gammaproteobacteria bacterium]
MTTAQQYRLEEGGLVDRSKPVRFTFNGKVLTGFEGDTLASALLANGVDIVGRSFKYHRPRGIVGAGSEEPNALVQLGTGATTEPNVRATQVLLYDGLEARVIKGWPSVKFDVQEALGFAGSVLAAGFYYKTFMGPTRRAWKFFERPIRKMAGMGVSSAVPDPDHYSHQHEHCDVLVAGAGPAGLVAALVAARTGCRVIVADERPRFGGQLLSSKSLLNGEPAEKWAASVQSELASLPNVRCLPNSTVIAYHDYNFLTVAENRLPLGGLSSAARPRQCLWKVRAKQVVLAQGAFERPLVFCNNDRPGVMQASAVSAYINQYGVAPGTRAVVVTNNDSAYSTAVHLHEAGVDVVAVVDSRQAPAGHIGQQVEAAGIALHQGHVVYDVTGRKRVSGAKLSALNESGEALVGATVSIDCDLVAMSGGWSPAVHLHSHSGGRNRWDAELLGFVPDTSPQACVSAGAGNGVMTLPFVLADGLRAGKHVCSRLDVAQNGTTPAVELPSCGDPIEVPIEALWRVPSPYNPDSGPKQFIDYQNDVGVSDVRLAVREGFRNVEHVKRYTALGFGTDQGKLGNINGMAILAELLGDDIPAVGTTTFRPNYTPTPFGTIAGPDVGGLYEPVRKTALHAWHEQVGARFEVVGQWHRPWYFPKDGEDLDAAVSRECLKTRESLGIMDASTLGKIEVYGPDACEFLELMYTHDIGKLEVGRCAYGIMLGEDGMVKDDGVMARIAENQYYLTTTTGGAAAVYAWLEFWLQAEYPHFNVFLTSSTDHNATIAVVGPNSRRLLQKLESDLDFGKEHFPFMAVKSGQLAGMPVQVFRISFSGELAFEINLHADYAMSMWTLLMEEGEEFEITPYGTEALHVLRAEKGFVIVGQDTDGTVTPQDLGMNWLLSQSKDYLGRRSLSRSDCVRSDRKQLVGLLSVDATTVVPEGAQVIEDENAEVPVPLIGHVSSSYYSACLQHPIALALVQSGRKRYGEIVYAATPDGRRIKVQIAKPVFYDPKGDKQRV